MMTEMRRAKRHRRQFSDWAESHGYDVTMDPGRRRFKLRSTRQMFSAFLAGISSAEMDVGCPIEVDDYIAEKSYGN